MTRKRTYARLFEDADVKRWYDNTARGSRVTADVYLRRVGSFCDRHKTTPKQLAKMEEKERFDLLLDFVSMMEEKGHAGSYIQSTLKAVKSWLAHNRIQLKGKIKIKGTQDTPTLRDERVPTRKELKKIFLSGDKKARVSSVLVAHSGLRIKTLGNYEGDDGLRVRDLPELKVEGSSIDFDQTPTLVIVRRELSKAGHQYFTFLGDEGCEYLKDYLEERIRGEERLTSDSPTVTPKLRMKPFIRAVNIGDIIRRAIRRAGFSWRPYVLRSYFDTQLMLAESKGLVLRDYRQFWMGHKGDIENRYTTNKGRLPEAVIEDMREAYKRSQEYLQTTKPEITEERLKDAFRKQLLLVAGFTQQEAEELELSALSDEEFQEIIRRRLLGEEKEDCGREKVIDLNEIESYLDEGWEYIATLPSGKSIIKSKTDF
ncbi:MAG: site-specific integrase [Candidatus Bathyarchaeota archaeon]|nr:site-specific integrase [Candidatus Bathyarchaeota archaeon]